MSRTPNGYVLEKANFSLSYLTRALQLLRRDELDVQEVEMSILAAIRDLAKVASHSTANDRWQTTDHKLIDEKLYEGLEELQKRWGFISETNAERETRMLEEIESRQFSRVRAILISGEAPSPARTLLSDYLQNEDLGDSVLRKVQELLEDVNMGKLSWTEFRIDALDWLESPESPQSN
jgi:hypothetical protein